MTTPTKEEKNWKQEAKLSWDAYISISKEARKIEKENKRLRREIMNYDKVINSIAKAIWRIK